VLSVLILCDELCSCGVWNSDGVCCSGLDVQTAPRRLGEGEVRHHATDHNEDLDDNGLFEGNEPLFPPNVLRPEDITDQEGFDDDEVLQHVHNVD
jgi:hypothetical protein